MPYGGSAWLAQTREEILEPEIPICDAHHHFWDFQTGFIPYERYLLDELVEDLSAGHNIRSTVFVEAHAMHRQDGPPELRPVGEVEFVQGVAAASASGCYGPCRVAAAIVGHADLMRGGRAKPVLEALQAASPNRFRGVRHMVSWDPQPVSWAGHPLPPSDAGQGMLASAEYRTASQALARMGLSLDMTVGASQLPELADFARALPDLPIILNHMGGVVRAGPYAGRDEEVLGFWRRGLAQVAACPNVHVKLGGVGIPRMGFGWHACERPVGSEEVATAIAPLLTACIDLFGPDRCMFEGNFPVDKVSLSHAVLFNAFKRFSKGYSATERAAMFHDTAVRVYRIEDA